MADKKTDQRLTRYRDLAKRKIEEAKTARSGLAKAQATAREMEVRTHQAEVAAHDSHQKVQDAEGKLINLANVVHFEFVDPSHRLVTELGGGLAGMVAAGGMMTGLDNLLPDGSADDPWYKRWKPIWVEGVPFAVGTTAYLVEMFKRDTIPGSGRIFLTEAAKVTAQVGAYRLLSRGFWAVYNKVAGSQAEAALAAPTAGQITG